MNSQSDNPVTRSGDRVSASERAAHRTNLLLTTEILLAASLYLLAAILIF